MKKLALLVLVLLFASNASAVCRYFAHDDRGFPAGISPSASNFSFTVEQGTSASATFDLNISADQSQGIRFSCSVELTASSPSNGVTISVEPSTFKTGGGFNKTFVTVQVFADENASSANMSIRITDADRNSTFVELPVEVIVPNLNPTPIPTAAASIQPTSEPSVPPSVSATPSAGPIESFESLPDTTKYLVLAGGVIFLLALLWFGFKSMSKD